MLKRLQLIQLFSFFCITVQHISAKQTICIFFDIYRYGKMVEL